MISRTAHVWVSPVARVENIAHFSKEPTNRELAFQLDKVPAVKPLVVTESYYSMTGNLLATYTRYLNTYA